MTAMFQAAKPSGPLILTHSALSRNPIRRLMIQSPHPIPITSSPLLRARRSDLLKHLPITYLPCNPSLHLNRGVTLVEDGHPNPAFTRCQCASYQTSSNQLSPDLTMCLGGHAYNDLREKMKEERHNSLTTNRQGGTDIDLLHISGSSGEGVSTVIIFIVCLLYTSPSPRDGLLSRMPSSA